MSTKRKAALAAATAVPEESDTPGPKRRKFSHLENETPDTTAQTGFDLLNQLRKSRDKQGWQIATHFQTLPDRTLIPEYYDEIALPIALDTLEGRLQQREYATISALESDVKRMISNAKSFNNKNSQIYSDAEKVRKLVSNFMVERNPAYKDPTYQAVPTPVPDRWVPKANRDAPGRPRAGGEVKTEHPSSELRNGRRTSRNAVHTPSEQDSRRASSTPAVLDTEDETGESFEGNTFQQAQAKIVKELMSLTDEDNRLVSANFIHLPPRTLLDYYKIIRHPVSLKGLHKLIQGHKGHAPPTGSTLLRSWNAYEEEASYIWNNAREYNEDGSEIVEMAEKLEEYFHERLTEAKAAVTEPPQPRVKLRVGGKSPEAAPRITLKFGHPKPNNASGITVDNEALKRQQELVKAGMNGQKPAPDINRPGMDRVRSGSSNGAAINGIKREASHAGSPALAAASQVNGVNGATMAPPLQLNAQIASGSPHPQAIAPPPPTYSSSNFNSQWRQAGKGASDALIANLNVSSRPEFNDAQRFHLDIPASEKRTHQSLTVVLLHNQNHIRIAPTLSSTLMQRPSKTFITCNNRRLQALAQRDLDQVRPIYEYTLMPGVNTIEVEIIAGLPRGVPKMGSGSDIEIEKIIIFAHLQAA